MQYTAEYTSQLALEGRVAPTQDKPALPDGYEVKHTQESKANVFVEVRLNKADKKVQLVYQLADGFKLPEGGTCETGFSFLDAHGQQYWIAPENETEEARTERLNNLSKWMGRVDSTFTTLEAGRWVASDLYNWEGDHVFQTLPVQDNDPQKEVKAVMNKFAQSKFGYEGRVNCKAADGTMTQDVVTWHGDLLKANVGSGAFWWIALVVVVIAAAGGGAYFYMQKKRRQDEAFLPQ